MPALWNPKEIIAYSLQGYEKKSWRLPDDWSDVRSVDLYQITLDGCVPSSKGIPVTDSRIVLSLEKGDSVSIVPSEE